MLIAASLSLPYGCKVSPILEGQEVTCRNNLDCDDNNEYTKDICLDAGTVNSSCKYQNVLCNTDKDCDDGFYCDGIERCVDGNCQDQPNPCDIGETCNEISDICEPIRGFCNTDKDCDDQNSLTTPHTKSCLFIKI